MKKKDFALPLLILLVWITSGLVMSCASKHDPPPEPAAARWPLPDIPPLPPGMDGVKVQKPEPVRRPRAASSAPRLAELTATDTNAPDYLVLSTLTISDGSNTFTANLGGFKYPKVQADAKSCVVIFTARWTNYVIEATADAGGFSNWTQVAKGAIIDTNAAIVIVDIHGGEAPTQWFRQREGSAKD